MEKVDVETFEWRLLLGYRLKKLRLLNKLSQDKLAENFHRSGATISAIERGDKNLTLETLYLLCKYFKISIDEFLDPIVKDSEKDFRGGFYESY